MPVLEYTDGKYGWMMKGFSKIRTTGTKKLPVPWRKKKVSKNLQGQDGDNQISERPLPEIQLLSGP